MRIVITAGGTREYIDPVRFISNASSGKMGLALNCAALKAGHTVTFITANPKFEIKNPKLKIIEVETTAQMFEAVKKYFPKSDCLIMTAAVSDYTPVHTSKTKIKRTGKNLTIKLKPTPDILKWAGKHKNKSRAMGHRPRIVVGFALEDKNLRVNAEKKLKEKNLDMIIVNTPSAIGADKSTVQIISSSHERIKTKNITKTAIAGKIIRILEKSKKWINSPNQIKKFTDSIAIHQLKLTC